jgi:hypothetical protein
MRIQLTTGRVGIDIRAAISYNSSTGVTFMHLIDIEICSNCGRDIARSEQAYVFEGKIVCAECDNALRASQIVEPAEIPEPPAAEEPTTNVEPQFEEPDQSKPDEQENNTNSGDVDKYPGFIIAGVILCILGIFLIVLGLLGLAVSFLAGILIGILPAGWLLILGILIIISGIAAIIIAATSRQS